MLDLRVRGNLLRLCRTSSWQKNIFQFGLGFAKRCPRYFFDQKYWYIRERPTGTLCGLKIFLIRNIRRVVEWIICILTWWPSWKARSLFLFPAMWLPTSHIRHIKPCNEVGIGKCGQMLELALELTRQMLPNEVLVLTGCPLTVQREEKLSDWRLVRSCN